MENNNKIKQIKEAYLGLMFMVVIALVAFCIIGMCTSCTTATASQLADSLVTYDEYYSTTEKLLNEIDKVHDWSTQYSDSGKEENIGYYHIRYILKDTKGMTISETYKALKTYYQETQELLQMLEDDYNWLDTVGEGDLYTEWFNIYKKIQR